MSTPEATTGGASTLELLASRLEEGRIHKPRHGNYLGQGGVVRRSNTLAHEAYLTGTSEGIRAAFIMEHPKADLYVRLGALSIGFKQGGVTVEGYAEPAVDDTYEQPGLAVLARPFGSWLAKAVTPAGNTRASKHQPSIEDLIARLKQQTHDIQEPPVLYPTKEQVQPLVNFVLGSQSTALYRRVIIAPGISGLGIHKVNSTIQPLS